MSRLADEIVQAVLKDLNDRGGFDDWWGDIDDETQDEIVETLVHVVDDALDG